MIRDPKPGAQERSPTRRQSTLATKLIWLVAAALFLVALGIWVERQSSRSLNRQDGQNLEDPLGTYDDELILDDEIGLEGSASGSVGAGAPPPFYGFCPNDAPIVDRPSMVTLVNDRLSELNDRLRGTLRKNAGSEGLRRGLREIHSPDADVDDAISAIAKAPDRVQDGFDHAAIASLLVASKALRSGDRSEAIRRAKHAARLDPADPAPQVLLAEIAHRERDEVAARRALARAFELAPDDPSVALAFGRRLSTTGDVDLALRALEVYLGSYPQDAHVAGLRARLEIRADLLADFQSMSSRGVTIWWSPEVAEEHAESTLETVLEALDRAARLLGTPRLRELTVFIYTARADMLAATCVQDWARAVHDGALHLDGEGFTRSNRMEARIIHESMHAQLHSVAPRSPVWLHEGLAQHLAQQRSAGHERSYHIMIEQRTWIPFSSLNGSFQVISDAGDARLAYHQSLAMVEYLIDRKGERSLNQAVLYLQNGGDPRGLLEHLTLPQPITGEDLLEFLDE